MTHNADLVLVDGGINDLHFGDLVMACLAFPNLSKCKHQLKKARGAINIPVKRDLKALLIKIRSKLRGGAEALDSPSTPKEDDPKIMLVGYPHLVQNISEILCPCESCKHGGFDAADELRKLADDLERSQIQAKDEANALGANAICVSVKTLFDGHEANPS